jgi:hypothetical protein
MTRALAIEVGQRVLVDVAEREARHEWLHGETIAVHIVDVGVRRCSYDGASSSSTATGQDRSRQDHGRRSRRSKADWSALRHEHVSLRS